jgi:hypothetical protein
MGWICRSGTLPFVGWSRGDHGFGPGGPTVERRCLRSQRSLPHEQSPNLLVALSTFMICQFEEVLRLAYNIAFCSV